MLSSDSSSTIQVTECGISSSVRSNTFSLMNSDMINDGELLVTVVSSKYFILSGKYDSAFIYYNVAKLQKIS